MLAFAHDRLTATLAKLGQPLDRRSQQRKRPLRSHSNSPRAMRRSTDIGLTAARIASAAAHLRRAREAIDASRRRTHRRWRELSPWGYALATTESFAAAPREVALRALSRLIEALGRRRLSRRASSKSKRPRLARRASCKAQGTHPWRLSLGAPRRQDRSYRARGSSTGQRKPHIAPRARRDRPMGSGASRSPCRTRRRRWRL